MSVPLLVTVAVLFATAFADGENCGVFKSADVANVEKTAHGEFPWLVALEYKMAGTQYIVGLKCGGAVINKRFVLTAAQCVTQKNFELHSAWLGVRKLSDANATDANIVKKIEIEKIIPHENYDPYKSTNDIALLKFNSDVKFSDYISPVCLPDLKSPLPSSETILNIAGWGQTGLCGPTTDLKLKAQLPFYSHSDCIDKWNVVVRADQICTAAESLENYCWRDTGTPIMESRPFGLERQWFAVGIVTSNEGCKNNLPVTHTRVSSYATWIAQKIYEYRL